MSAHTMHTSQIHPPPSPNPKPAKRQRPNSPDRDSPPPSATASAGPGARSPSSEFAHDGAANLMHTSSSSAAPSIYGGGGGGVGKVGQSSNFRNVSACNRCRLRKNRCDQRLPSCVSCEKAGVACVGYDPITKQEIPRSYVFYLETRIEQLETLLKANDIPFPPAENLEYCAKLGNDSSTAASPGDASTRVSQSDAGAMESVSSRRDHRHHQSNGDGPTKLQKLVSKTVPGSSNPRYLGSATGISFARVVFAAVQSSVSDQKSTSDKGGIRPYSKPLPGTAGASSVAGGTSMRDSFFGLHTKPTIHPATFPDRKLGMRLVELYFQHANPQIPVLHREEFMRMFDQAYVEEGQRVRGPKELYMLNMVFAIGGGIILAESKAPPPPPPASAGKSNSNSAGTNGDGKDGSKQCQAEEYHASAIVHLEACLSSGGGLEELQAVLLLANFALLRPVPPGLWYIIGVAMRLAIDLGLHYEDGKDPQDGLGETPAQSGEAADRDRERGRREYIRDLRRRLWWCTYSLDRLVSICVGRPFGVSDQVITTEFPSLLEDRYITPHGGLQEPENPELRVPTYKLVAEHYFRLRLLQSEILQVLQFQQAQLARAGGQNSDNPYMHTSLPSPFLSRFDSFRTWRIDIDRRLYEWRESSPSREQTGVEFSTDFLSLNYWQAIIMLYRQSLSVPTMFEGEYNTSKEMNSPSVHNVELREDEDRVYLKVAEAGQRILRLYRGLHLQGVVNYTYLATHHLFIAGISYLYAIWHSPIVRSRLTSEEVDFTILAANSVFTDLSDKCPPAESCRDAFDRTAKATIKMAASTGGFGQVRASGGHRSSSRNSVDHQSNSRATTSTDWAARSDTSSHRSRPAPPHHQHHQGHHRRRSTEHGSHSHTRSQSHSHRSDTASYALSSAASPPIQSLGNPQFRLATLPDIKPDPGAGDNNPFGLVMPLQQQLQQQQQQQPPPHSVASNSSVAGTPDSVVGLGGGGGGGGDPTTTTNVMAVSPTFAHQQSPANSVVGLMNSPGPITPRTAAAGGASTMDSYLQQQQQQQQHQGSSSSPQQPTSAFTPGLLSFADMQGIEFLQGLGGTNDGGGGGGNGNSAGGGGPGSVSGTGGGGGPGSASSELGGVPPDAQMDIGLGLGWEGMHHDFSDGPQLDLFDGFFFGGGGGGAGGVL